MGESHFRQREQSIGTVVDRLREPIWPPDYKHKILCNGLYFLIDKSGKLTGSVFAPTLVKQD